jgi:hypothetical protein
VHGWLRGPARLLVEDLLAPRSIAEIPGLDAKAVGAVVADHMNQQRSYGFELWGLMVLVAWHRKYVRDPFVVPSGPVPRTVEFASCAA